MYISNTKQEFIPSVTTLQLLPLPDGEFSRRGMILKNKPKQGVDHLIVTNIFGRGNVRTYCNQRVCLTRLSE